MVWLRRDFGETNWGGFQDQFELMFVEMGAPSDMMLVATRRPGEMPSVLYACFPQGLRTDVLPGFEPVSEDEIPQTAILLVGHRAAFANRFDFPER